MCMMYNAIVLPHIDYCSPIWTNTANKYVNRIQVLQNHVARLTLGCKVRDKHVREIYDELKWMNVRERSDYCKTDLMYRCIKSDAPDILTKCILDRKITHSHFTRSQSSNTGNIYIQLSRTDWGRRTFNNSGAMLWNNLPTNVKDSLSIQSFKKALKNLVLNSAV